MPTTFEVLIDLHLHFGPWMSDHGRGLVLTRSIRLPFAPTSKTLVFGRSIDECELPVGLCLQEVIWDMDRSLFLAFVEVCPEEDLARVPEYLQVWLRKGWRFGSWHDDYPNGSDDEPGNARRRSRRKRPPGAPRLSRFTKAMIRQMAEGYDNDWLAYAWDRTGTFLSDLDIEEKRRKVGANGGTDDFLRFVNEVERFKRWTPQRRDVWRESVMHYPTLQQLALATT